MEPQQTQQVADNKPVQQPEPEKKVEQRVEVASPSNEIKSSDILSRINKTKQDPKQPEQFSEETQFFNVQDIDKVQDPKQKEMLMGIYKNMERGLHGKFQKIAEERKTLEQKMEELGRKQEWTPDRVNQLLQDQTFVQSAQALNQQRAPQNWEGSQDEWSALSQHERAAFQKLEGQVNSLLQNQSRMQISQYDNQIKSKFPDYEPEHVDRFQQDILNGKLDDGSIRELIWKATNFDRYIENAYKLARDDRDGSLKEKMAASSTMGISSQTSADKPVMKEGEDTRSYFRRLAQFNLSKQKNK